MKNNVVSPLYKRDQWVRWQKLFDAIKGSRMDGTFDEWLQRHHDMLEKFKVQGDTVHEVEVDIDEYLAWTKERGLPVNGYTRTDFPGFILHQRMYPGGHYDVTPPVA